MPRKQTMDDINKGLIIETERVSMDIRERYASQKKNPSSQMSNL